MLFIISSILSVLEIGRHPESSATLQFSKIRYHMLNLTAGVPENHQSSYCYYLDYEGSLNLTLDGEKYSNPIIYCPYTSSDIIFEPDTLEVGYSHIMNLTAYVTCSSSLYILNTSFATKAPVHALTGSISFIQSQAKYGDVFVIPASSFSVVVSPNIAFYFSNVYSYGGAFVPYSHLQNYYTINVSSVTMPTNYTMKRTDIQARFNIAFTSGAPNVLSLDDGYSIEDDFNITESNTTTSTKSSSSSSAAVVGGSSATLGIILIGVFGYLYNYYCNRVEVEVKVVESAV